MKLKDKKNENCKEEGDRKLLKIMKFLMITLVIHAIEKTFIDNIS